MYMMAFCSTCLAYISVALVELFHIAAIAGCVYMGMNVKGDGNSSTGYYITAGVFALFFLLFNCLLCCFRDKFAIALAVIDSAADFLVATKRLAIIPLLYFFSAIIYLVIWAFAVPGVIALNDITASSNSAGSQQKNIKWTG
jgi:hypothetical protein